MVNVVLVEQRLGLIAGYLRAMESLSLVPKDEFLGDEVRIAAAESFLRRTLEAVFDIGRHVLAKSGFVNLAAEYKSIARGLVERGFIDSRLGDVLVEMAGYRNRLVHLYNEISAEEIHSIIAGHLGDVRDYVRQMRSYLQSLAY